MGHELLRMRGNRAGHVGRCGIFPCGQALANIVSSPLNITLLKRWAMCERFFGSCALRDVCHGRCGKNVEVVGRGSHSFGSREQSWAAGPHMADGSLGFCSLLSTCS